MRALDVSGGERGARWAVSLSFRGFASTPSARPQCKNSGATAAKEI